MRGALALVVIAVVLVGDDLHTIDDHWPVEGPSREGTAIPFGVCPCSGDCAYIAHHFGPIYARRYPAGCLRRRVAHGAPAGVIRGPVGQPVKSLHSTVNAHPEERGPPPASRAHGTHTSPRTRMGYDDTVLYT